MPAVYHSRQHHLPVVVQTWYHVSIVANVIVVVVLAVAVVAVIFIVVVLVVLVLVLVMVSAVAVLLKVLRLPVKDLGQPTALLGVRWWNAGAASVSVRLIMVRVGPNRASGQNLVSLYLRARACDVPVMGAASVAHELHLFLLRTLFYYLLWLC